MDVSHVSQAIVLDNAQLMPISTGMDMNYADYLFDIRIKGEEGQAVRILNILKKYSRMGGENSISHNPELYVIYENLETGVVDVSIVPTYHFNHVTFGFRYIFTRELENLKPNDIVPTGTLLATTPSYDIENQSYGTGMNVLTAFGSFPEVVEDGIAISESLSERMSARRFGTLTINYGADDYLLNIYGDENNYQPFPEIGQRIRDDGLVFACRKLDIGLAPVQMTPRALQEVDYTFDRLYYGLANAIIEDITVEHSHDPSKYYIPTGMKTFPSKYFTNHDKFYRDLEKLYYGLKAKKKSTLVLSPELHHLIVTGMRQDHNKLKRANRVTYRKEELKEYRITITYSIRNNAEMGSKLSSTSADKGVVVKIIPDDKMPKTKDGRVVEMLLASGSSTHRMNPGRNFEHECNASLYQERNNVRKYLQEKGLAYTWDYLMDYYSVLSPAYHEIISQGITRKEDKAQHVDEFIRGQLQVYMPYGSVKTGTEHSLKINEMFPVKFDTIYLYDEYLGNHVESISPFMVADMYIIRLEKIGENWASTSIPRRQHHGVISKLSSDTKTALPYRDQAIRFGETEHRSFLAACNPAVISSMLIMANNSEMCNDAVRTILTADKPTAIRELVPYHDIQKYQSVSVMRTYHMMGCYGLKFTYEDDADRLYETMDDIGVEVTDYRFSEDD